MSVNFKTIRAYIAIIIGALIASFSVACILLPNDAIDYGTAGIAIIISMLTGTNLSLCVTLVFLPFLIASFFFMGKDFFLRAITGASVYIVGLEIFEKIPFELNTEHFLAVAFGGAILGAGLSIILRFSSCIDGSEILASIVCKKYSEIKGRNISMSGILVGFNACVYAAAFVLLDRNSALLSLLVYVVATAVIDHFTDHFEQIKQVTIITKKPETIIAWIRDDMKKTCTIMNSRGAIAGENKTLICYVNYFELEKLRENIHKLEGTAFITVSTIDEIIK